MTIMREDLEAGRLDRPGAGTTEAGQIGPIHPGETLRDDVVLELGLSASAFARELHVPVNRITGILNGQRSITGDTALRLARYLGTSAGFWLRLQAQYDEEVARLKHGARIEREIKPRPA